MLLCVVGCLAVEKKGDGERKERKTREEKTDQDASGQRGRGRRQV